jgi:oligo-1,6-glucosidase
MNERSIWNHYPRLILLRNSHFTIVYSRFQSYLDHSPDILPTPVRWTSNG